MRILREQSPLTQHDQSPYVLIETEAIYSGPARVCTRSCVYICDLQFSVFREFLSVQTSPSLTLVPSPGVFSSVQF